MAFTRLKGFKDITGDEAVLFERMERTARQVFTSFGFEEIRTPVLEEAALFSRALGTETDVVQKEMYEFTDRSQTRVAMRPEGTASVVRAYIENNFDKTKGLAKFFYMGPMFRSERPQAGRLRQFHQIGVEQLGTASPLSDAETIHCLTVFLDKAGVRGYKLRLNNLGTFEERRHFKEELKKYFQPHLGALCDDCRQRFEKNVFRLLDCKRESCHKIVLKSPPLANYLVQESKDHYTAVCEALTAAGVAYEQDVYMVRGLDYYTKTVFEVSHPGLGAQDAVAAGGRYDALVESFGGTPAGAVGFALGVERLLMCAEPSVQGGAETSFFVVALGEAAMKEGFKIISWLRAEGLHASMDFSAKSMKSQMRSADKSGSRYTFILGDNELAKGVVVLKNLEIGAQKEFPLDRQKLVEICKKPQLYF